MTAPAGTKSLTSYSTSATRPDVCADTVLWLTASMVPSSMRSTGTCSAATVSTPSSGCAAWPQSAASASAVAMTRSFMAGQNAAPGLTPRRLRMRASGQNPVNDAWNRLKPTKALSQYQYSLTNEPSANPTSTRAPANLITIRSIVIACLQQSHYFRAYYIREC